MRLPFLQFASRRNEVGRTVLADKQHAIPAENDRSTLDNWRTLSHVTLIKSHPLPPSLSGECSAC